MNFSPNCSSGNFNLNTEKVGSVAERFEVIAANYAHKIAVETKEESLTYLALNQRANRIARIILEKKQLSEQPIATLLSHGGNYIASIFGVLKSGNFYIPLDPDFPKERIKFILEDTNSKIIITDRRNVELAQEVSPDNCLILNLDEVNILGQSENLQLDISPHTNAYIIYTSGSTGKPKGVVQSQKNLLSNCTNQVNAVDLKSSDRMSLIHSFSVSGSLRALYNALLNGLSLFPFDVKRSGLDGLRDWILDKKITAYHSVPTLFRYLMHALPPGYQFPAMRLIILGGEAATQQDFEFYQNHFPDECQLVTTLGSTETGTVCVNILDKNATATRSPLPPGYPVSNTKVSLLDPEGNPVPQDEVGEIVVESDHLALGYWQRDDLTQKSFFHVSGHETRRGYRMGDLGQLEGDGCLIHLGRRDFQVKVRGYRIELAEIEAALLDTQLIKEAVVLGRRNDSQDMYLTAYYVVKEQALTDAYALRKRLLEKLPDYMLPDYFVELRSLPLTANGKINRLALPEPDMTHSASTLTPYVAPVSEIEQKLTELWAVVLNIDTIGIRHNFFELGGNSLSIFQVLSRLKDEFKVEISAKEFFETPTIKALAEVVALRKADRDQALSSSLLETTDGEQSITPCDRALPLPVSFAQQRFWFLHQLDPEGSAYHILRTFKLTGVLDVSALHQAIATVVERHEALRTRFETVDGELRQVIQPFQGLELSILDWSCKEEKFEKEPKEVLRVRSQQPFDLTGDLLLRATLIRLGEEEHLLHIVIHHIAADNWSVNILIRELSLLYQAYQQKESNPLDDLAVQYADFAVWQHNLQEDLSKQLDYWKNKLAGDLPSLQLPMDYPPPKRIDHSGREKTLRLSAELTKNLKALSQQQQTTLFMTLMAALQILLHRYTGQDDVIVGSPVAGRPKAEVEGLMGLFLNSLALRTNLGGNPPFVDLLKQVRATALEAYANQQVSFERIVEALNPERHLNRHPIFEVMLNVLNAPEGQWQLPGLEAEILRDEDVESKFAFTLYVKEEKSRLHLRLVYQTALFCSERMDVLLSQLQGLLEQIVAQPEAPIETYSLRTWDTQSILPDPTEAIAVPAFRPVTSLITELEVPQRSQPAVWQDGQYWTYQELNQSAVAIASQLAAMGLQPGDVVALSGDRCFGLVTSLVGILLSGGVLLTLDPHLPQQRRQMMVVEAQAKYLINVGEADSDLLKEMPFQNRPPLSVDPQSGTLTMLQPAEIGEAPLPVIEADAPAYIFFTSGTTGKPKAILGRHSGLSHFLNWQRETFSIGVGDRVAQLTGLSFDVVLRDILLPLTSGATLYLPSADTLLASRLLPWLQAQNITVLHSVPSLLKVWLADVPEGTALPTLRWLFSAGEPLQDTLVKRWRQTFPESGEIVNLYGPTETTLAKCYAQIPSTPTFGVQPIGQPLTHTQALLLSDQNRLCGVGEIGEIVIRTPFRSLGYIQATKADRERFFANPFRNDSNDILYRTGDLGRYRLGGSLDILGRIDHQVKVRGVRIELSEVEAALLRQPMVKAAAVVPVINEQGEKQLAAYVVPSSGAQFVPSVARQALKQELLDAMIPSSFTTLEILPLTANGKVDRGALPKPDINRDETVEFVGPRTPIEEQLSQLWCRLLNLDKVSIYDNFFELGGHSLLMTRMLSAIANDLQVDLPLTAVFEAPTIAELTFSITVSMSGCQNTANDTEATADYDQMVALLDELDTLSEADVSSYGDNI